MSFMSSLNKQPQNGSQLEEKIDIGNEDNDIHIDTDYYNIDDNNPVDVSDNLNTLIQLKRIKK